MVNFLDKQLRVADLARWDGQQLCEWYAFWNRWLSENDYPVRCPQVTERFVVKKGHPFHTTPEIFVQLRGSTFFETPGEDFELRPGDILIMPRGVGHRETLKPEDGQFCNFVIMFARERLNFHLTTSNEQGRPRPVVGHRRPLLNSPQAQRYLEEIVLSRMGFSNLGTEGEEHLWKTFCRLIHHALNLPPNRERRESPRITRARLYIQNNLQNPALTVRQVAELLHCSADYLSHQFHQEVGMRFTEYIRRARMDFAIELLRDTSLTVSEIAFACGFQSSGYFIKVFRTRYGMSPGALRRENRFELPEPVAK